ncbi:hypothetical protein [Bacillus sp. AK128]
MKVYDQHFNANEWFVLVVLILMYLTIFLLPKRFPLSVSIIFTLLGFYLGLVADHSIAIPPFDFYDVNDNSSYEFFDFLTYVMYGPYGYLFLYFYHAFNIKGYKVIFYIIFWSLLGMLLEYIGVRLGVFHYNQGYKFLFSFPIYLSLQSITLAYYHALLKKSDLIIPKQKRVKKPI